MRSPVSVRGQIRDLPVAVQRASTLRLPRRRFAAILDSALLWACTDRYSTPGREDTCADTSIHVAFRKNEHVDTRIAQVLAAARDVTMMGEVFYERFVPFC